MVIFTVMVRTYRKDISQSAPTYCREHKPHRPVSVWSLQSHHPAAIRACFFKFTTPPDIFEYEHTCPDSSLSLSFLPHQPWPINHRFFRYTPQKNKQRLQMKKVRRKSMNPPGTKDARERQDPEKSVVVDGEGGVTNGGNGDSSRSSGESRNKIGV